MIDMPQTFAAPREIAPAAGLAIEPAEYGRPSSAGTLTNPHRPEFGNALTALPRTSLSVMVVIDDNGYLMPLCTAGDLLRWCKAAWRAERD